MIEAGALNPTQVVRMCLAFMSERDVTEMLQDNQLFELYDEEEDEG